MSREMLLAFCCEGKDPAGPLSLLEKVLYSSAVSSETLYSEKRCGGLFTISGLLSLCNHFATVVKVRSWINCATDVKDYFNVFLVRRV